jgi:UDP-3-O-[3-hydroxymyristoyl] glucosamine N-acyltransferase LpxD
VKAVIMAGGEGTRLRPLTMSQPKPMLPMANRPMVEHVVGLLRRHGFDEIVVTVAYLASTIRTYFGDGSEFGVRIVYATEETPLGTAGSVLNARAELDERFLVISGDVLTDIDLGGLVAVHEKSGALATLALKAMENPLEFGIVITDESGRVERLLEKPTWGQVFSDTVNTGIYVLEPEVLDAVAPGRAVDFSSEVFPSLLAAGAHLQGWVTDSYWEDVGTLGAYLQAHADVLDAKVGLRVDAFTLRPGIFVGEGAEIDPTALVEAPALVGANCRIGPRARVGPYAVLGANVSIGDHTHIDAGVVLGEGVRIGAHCHLHPRVVVYAGTLVGDRVVLHAGCVLGSDGFGYARHAETGAYLQFPQQGKLVIEEDVEIGANTTIDRGALEETRIARGSKLDNLVHIGHNVRVGRNVVIAAQTGISGSSSVGDDAILGGQVGVGEHAEIGPQVILGGGAGVLSQKKLRGPGAIFWGRPAQPLRDYLKSLAALARLSRRTKD